MAPWFRDTLASQAPSWTLAQMKVEALGTRWLVVQQSEWQAVDHAWVAECVFEGNLQDGQRVLATCRLRVRHNWHRRHHDTPGYVDAIAEIAKAFRMLEPGQTYLGELSVQSGDLDVY